MRGSPEPYTFTCTVLDLSYRILATTWQSEGATVISDDPLALLAAVLDPASSASLEGFVEDDCGTVVGVWLQNYDGYSGSRYTQYLHLWPYGAADAVPGVLRSKQTSASAQAACGAA